MLIITSKKPGFRRCGVAHPAEPTEHPERTFTAQQIEILKKEPMLTVTMQPDDPEKDKKADSKGSRGGGK